MRNHAKTAKPPLKQSSHVSQVCEDGEEHQLNEDVPLHAVVGTTLRIIKKKKKKDVSIRHLVRTKAHATQTPYVLPCVISALPLSG